MVFMFACDIYQCQICKVSNWLIITGVQLGDKSGKHMLEYYY